ncbi:MAG: hypothetical protein IJR99_09555 [Kiritimatiellae bacterium]|nr:hypothetical protein [Kiritimatiellia bacterium]
MGFDKDFLKRVLSIPSVSYWEERVRDFILEFAKRRAITAKVDALGNVYLIKGMIGDGEYVPCFVNHMDTVQDSQYEYVCRDERLPVLERKNAEGKTELYVDGFGIGGDDKAGVALALALMDALPKCKAVFFVQEEKGLLGSQEMDYDFLKDVSLLITMDCWGRVRTASEWRKNGAKMYSTKFYDQVLKEVFERHGVTVLDHPANTDICNLMMRCDLCCCDISNGGYYPHRSNEYVCVEDAKAGYDLILDLCRSLDGRRAYRITPEERGG